MAQPPLSGASLTFANSGSGQNTNDLPAGTSFAGITFAAGASAFNLQGHAIQLSGPVINQSNVNQTISLDMQVVTGGGTLDSGSGSMTIAGAISGSALTKVGAGSLILSGSNNYMGGTTVLDGTLEIVTADALPTGGGLTIGAGAPSLFDAGLAAGIETTGGWIDDSGTAQVPEPGTLALLAVGAAAIAGVIRGWRGWSANNRILEIRWMKGEVLPGRFSAW